MFAVTVAAAVGANMAVFDINKTLRKKRGRGRKKLQTDTFLYFFSAFYQLFFSFLLANFILFFLQMHFFLILSFLL